MNNIPKNCLDKFIATYKNFPSIIELVIDKEGVDKIVKNKTILWSYKKIIDGTIDIIDRETLLEIDANGIYLYIEQKSDDDFLLYFLFLQNYLSNVNFIISKLTKTNKNGIKQ